MAEELCEVAGNADVTLTLPGASAEVWRLGEDGQWHSRRGVLKDGLVTVTVPLATFQGRVFLALSEAAKARLAPLGDAHGRWKRNWRESDRIVSSKQ